MSNRKVKWGILSTANIGRTLVIPAFQRSINAEVVAIASRGEKAFEVAEELSIPTAYTSYDQLLDDPEIEAVYIPLPNHLHKEWVIKAAQAKKHVLVEKPAGLTVAEVQDMIKACEENDVIIMEAFMYRFHRQHQKVIELIKNNAIGNIQMIRGSFSFLLRNPTENIRMRTEYGGGALYDVGCYPLNSIRYFLGEPESVYAEATFHEKGVDTTAQGILGYRNGVRGVFDCSFSMNSRNEYEIIGTNGTIKVLNAYRPDISGNIGEIELMNTEGYKKLKVEDDQYKNQTEHISQCIIENIKPVYSIYNTLLNMKVIDATYHSIKNRVRVSIDSNSTDIQ